MPLISPGRTIQGNSLDSYQRCDTCALVAWKPGELAIFLPLRHDLASLDVPSPDREWACKYIRARNLAVRCLSHNQRHSYVAISLDRPNPAVEAFLLQTTGPFTN